MAIRRSELTTPASNARMIEKASEGEADAIMFDLEDAVAHDEKESSREMVINGIEEHEWGDKLLSVRVNDLNTPYCYMDIITLVESVGERLDLLTIPKVSSAEEIFFVDTLLSQIEKSNDITDGVGLEVLIETAAGVDNVSGIASASNRLEALIFGPGDYSVSLGIPFEYDGFTETGYPGDKWHSVRTSIADAAHSNGLQAIDGPYPDFSDPDGFKRQCDLARELGFVGKWAIHPSQISGANQAFTPTDHEIDEAEKIVDAIETAENEGQGAVNVDGVMYDLANIKYARDLLERAEEVGAI